MKYTTVLWDADNTLLDFEYSMRESLQAAFTHFGMKDFLDEEKLAVYRSINHTWWTRLEKGEVTRSALLNGRFEDFFAVYDIKTPTPLAYREVFQVELGRHYAYIPGAMEICRALQGRVKQYIITNGVTITQKQKLTASGFAELMDEIFVSEQLGADKPARAFFDAVFALIPEKDLSKILVVGDSLSSDIKGANDAGVDACWYNPEKKELPQGYHVTADICTLEEVWSVITGEEGNIDWREK